MNLAIPVAAIASSLFAHSLAVAEFKGRDSLAGDSSNWGLVFKNSDRNRFDFRNHRLEYTSSGNFRRSYLKWTPNRGSPRGDWYIQATIHCETDAEMGLAVINTEHYKKGYHLSTESGAINGFKCATFKGGESQSTRNRSETVTFRIHYNHLADTLTASWRTRASWHYFSPVPAKRLEVPPGGSFTAILTGDKDQDPDTPGGGAHLLSPAGSKSKNYFRDFQCGPAHPEIGVEVSPTHLLKSSANTLRFGIARQGDKGITKRLTIRNEGTAPLRRLEITKQGNAPADFRITRPGKETLRPGESTTFGITFRPKAQGGRRAEILIRNNDHNENPFVIHVAGTGSSP